LPRASPARLLRAGRPEVRRFHGAAQHRDLGLQLVNALERAHKFTHARGRFRAEQAILAFDKRGDLLEEAEQCRPDPAHVVARGLAAVQRHDRAVEHRQRVVIARVGVAPRAIQLVDVIGGHAGRPSCFQGKRAIITGIYPTSCGDAGRRRSTLLGSAAVEEGRRSSRSLH